MTVLTEKHASGSNAQLSESLKNVHEALSGLQFGSVSITVHEGRVVQIDVTEKRRLEINSSRGAF